MYRTLFCFYPILGNADNASGWFIDYTNRLVGIVRLRLKKGKIGNLIQLYYYVITVFGITSLKVFIKSNQLIQREPYKEQAENPC